MTEVTDHRAADASAPASDASEKQCGNPDCLQMSPSDALFCWLCDYDFKTGSMPHVHDGAEAQPAHSGAVAVVPIEPLAVSTEPGAPTAADHSQRETKETDRAEPIDQPGQGDEDILRPRVIGVAADQDVAHHEISAAEEDIYAIDMAAGIPADTNCGATVVTLAEKKGSQFDVEPGAISIPPMNIVHPTGPHVVIFLDLEPRRSRKDSDSPPEAREPVVIELTGEAHAFGKLTRAFDVSFDSFASSLHGFFQKNEVAPGYCLRDMSTNGTKLNGRYVEKGEPKPLRDGDVITFGKWSKLVFFAGGGAPVADASSRP